MNIIIKLIIPSLICIIVPLIIVTFILRGNVEQNLTKNTFDSTLPQKKQYIVLFSGISILILVPVFKTVTHLPPFMGMLLGLGILWVITEIIHGDKDEEDKNAYSVVNSLRKIDTPSILFFLGILVSIGALQSTGVLSGLSKYMSQTIGNDNVIIITMGLLSSIVDNVPLVAAAQGMYSMVQYPTDHYFWEFLAYSTGTGGSALIIGSAAGVAAMGIEKIKFFWYLKKISWLALIGFFAGAGTYILQHYLF